jgi:RNA polymerase sigma-70 factor (ECF subfamily)
VRQGVCRGGGARGVIKGGLAANQRTVSESERDFEEIFNACYEPVRRYAARRVADEAVQDVVSETFLTAWRRREELHGAALPWLLGIARRVASTQRRGNARRTALHTRLRTDPPSPPAATDGGGRDAQLALALASLRERDREALLLVVWDGLDHRTAAAVMGCTTGSLTVRLHRARRRLAQLLADERREPAERSDPAESREPREWCEEARSS